MTRADEMLLVLLPGDNAPCVGTNPRQRTDGVSAADEEDSTASRVRDIERNISYDIGGGREKGCFRPGRGDPGPSGRRGHGLAACVVGGASSSAAGWVRAAVTYRLEANISKSRALAIAAALH